MHDLEELLQELLHQIDGFQRELEAVLEQVTCMELAKLKQKEELFLHLKVPEVFYPETLDDYVSHIDSPEQRIREMILRLISQCSRIRNLSKKTIIDITNFPDSASQLLEHWRRLSMEIHTISFGGIVVEKAFLWESYAEGDISALGENIGRCYNSYENIMVTVKKCATIISSYTTLYMCQSTPRFFRRLQRLFPTPGSKARAKETAKYIAQIVQADAEEPPVSLTDDVQFRAVAPASLQRDSYAMLKVMMYRGDDYEQADREARRIAKEIKEDASGVFSIQRYQKLTIRLQSADVQIEEDTQELVWNGRYTCCSFEIFLPSDFPKKQVHIKGRVYQGLTVLTDLRLILDVEVAPCERTVPMERCTLKSAFLSYASQDRSRVSACIRGILLVRPDMDLFFDAVSLRRGERYEKRILHEIESRDLFYLFWSRHASLSQWVNKELEHALKSKGADCIEPVPLEPPDICPPPQALNDRHFNDWILRYESEQRLEQPPTDYVLRSTDGYEIAIPPKGGVVGRTQLGSGYLSNFHKISRAHICITPQPDGGVFIEDLGSRNGTFLNGQRIHGPVYASVGSRITLANMDFSLLKLDVRY